MTNASSSAVALIEFNKDLKALNTLSLPGAAEQFAQFSSVSELLSLLAYARQKKMTVKVLGGGSNVLMPAQVDGLVLQSSMQAIEIVREDENSVSLRVDAGKDWHAWVVESQQYGHGIENLALIPGTVGASPIQNIGAYGVEVADVLDEVQGVCLSSMQLMTLSKNDCRFGYRDSIFKRELKNDFIVTSVTFRLTKSFNPNVSYGPLAQWASENSGFFPQDLINQVCAIRSSKLPDPVEIPNAGSFFKNPVVSAAVAEKLRSQFPDLPGYWQSDGSVKLAAGWLIEQAGWKGKSLGKASMHSLQALVLTTSGTADLADVFAIRDAVFSDVKEKFNVELEPEPQVF